MPDSTGRDNVTDRAEHSLATSMERVPTGISKAFWCSMTGGEPSYEPAQVVDPETGSWNGTGISWFDELLKGGIALPPPGHRPLTMLVTGPPGSGKTTLTMELCYRLATDRNLCSLYVSTDQDTDLMVANGKAILHVPTTSQIVAFTKAKTQEDMVPVVAVCGRDIIPAPPMWRKLLRRAEPTALTLAHLALAFLKGWHIVMHQPEVGKEIDSTTDQGRKVAEQNAPHILVVDGINSIEASEQPVVFRKFLNLAKSRLRLIIFILDSSPSGSSHRPWEYACDTAIELGYAHKDKYYTRSIEIIKARYQENVWGRHQLKIYPASRSPREKLAAASESSEEIKTAVKAAIRRGHPYRTQGGVFIFPSIHYYLSRYKRGGSISLPHSTPPSGHAETLPIGFTKWLHQGSVNHHVAGTTPKDSLSSGLPEGRCTAFIGVRGGHKSHLGYLHLLHRMKKHKECGLVISLRDDEAMTRRTMSRILRQEILGEEGAEGGSIHPDLQGFESDDYFEILYYHPGYITPEEFFHRMFISIQRLRKRNKPLTVLFNSLDQLASRFPLCAKEEIFVPGIIEVLTGECATSIFIAVDEKGQPPEQYGLLPMADLIVSFNPHRFKGKDYYTILEQGESIGTSVDRKKWNAALLNTYREEMVLQVVRFAGGQRAGARGILELASTDSMYGKAGLHFTPLNDAYRFTLDEETSLGSASSMQNLESVSDVKEQHK